MAHVFISYSHKDTDYVNVLAAELMRWGIQPWVDGRIDYGASWPKAIQDNLNACPFFIVVMSTTAYESEWVQNEVSYASRKKKPIIPILLEGDNWLSLESRQYVDVRSRSLPPSNFFQQLIDSLRKYHFPQSNGTIYCHKHLGRLNGLSQWGGTAIVARGSWIQVHKHMFYGGNNVIYGVDIAGSLWQYHHLGRLQGNEEWSNPTLVAPGIFVNSRFVFYGGDGIIYSVSDNGELWWSQQLGGWSGIGEWKPPRLIGNGFFQSKHVFYGGDNIIYAVSNDGSLWWGQHTGRVQGINEWTEFRVVGNGRWDLFKFVFYAGDNIIYAVSLDGNLWWFQHMGRWMGISQWTDGGRIIAGGWNQYANIFYGNDDLIYTIY